MINKDFELDRLKAHLLNRGIDNATVDVIVAKADQEIESAMATKMQEAMDTAIQIGVDKDSPDFINDVRPSPGVFALDTASGSLDFSLPPFPMLPRLLQHAKPMKDGSGVYKVIPVGTPGKNKPSIATNIFDAQKAVAAERAESAKRQYNRIAPGGSAKFRTATSKQSQNTSWVKPSKEADFTNDVRDINDGLQEDLEDIVLRVIKDYEGNF